MPHDSKGYRQRFRDEVAPVARDVRWTGFRIFLIAIPVIIFLYVLFFGLTWIGIEWHGFFGAKRAAVERKIFEETPSFVQGKISMLTKLRFEWLRKKDDPEAQRGIESMVRNEFAYFKPEHLKDRPDLLQFYNHCMGR